MVIDQPVKRYFCSFLCFLFIYTCVLNSTALAQIAAASLPLPGEMIGVSTELSYPMLKGLKLDPNDPLKLEFIIDTAGKDKITEQEASKLVQYFLAAVTVPQDDLWVNLSPYEKDRIITDELGSTELGSGLLSQDYVLKQFSSSLTDPNTTLGRAYWGIENRKSKLEKGSDLISGFNSPVYTERDAFSKVWIVPEESEVYEHDNQVFITKATLDIKAESPQMEVLISAIKYEVNNGENFAPLRQAHHSVILGLWFKQRLRESIYAQFIDQNKMAGIDTADKALKDQVFNAYVESFKSGVYNRTTKIKENEKLRKISYFSGGMTYANSAITITIKKALNAPIKFINEAMRLIIDIVPGSLKQKAAITAKKIIMSAGTVSILMGSPARADGKKGDAPADIEDDDDFMWGKNPEKGVKVFETVGQGILVGCQDRALKLKLIFEDLYENYRFSGEFDNLLDKLLEYLPEKDLEELIGSNAQEKLRIAKELYDLDMSSEKETGGSLDAFLEKYADNESALAVIAWFLEDSSMLSMDRVRDQRFMIEKIRDFFINKTKQGEEYNYKEEIHKYSLHFEEIPWYERYPEKVAGVWIQKSVKEKDGAGVEITYAPVKSTQRGYEFLFQEVDGSEGLGLRYIVFLEKMRNLLPESVLNKYLGEDSYRAIDAFRDIYEIVNSQDANDVIEKKEKFLEKYKDKNYAVPAVRQFLFEFPENRCTSELFNFRLEILKMLVSSDEIDVSAYEYFIPEIAELSLGKRDDLMLHSLAFDEDLARLILQDSNSDKWINALGSDYIRVLNAFIEYKEMLRDAEKLQSKMEIIGEDLIDSGVVSSIYYLLNDEKFNFKIDFYRAGEEFYDLAAARTLILEKYSVFSEKFMSKNEFFYHFVLQAEDVSYDFGKLWNEKLGSDMLFSDNPVHRRYAIMMMGKKGWISGGWSDDKIKELLIRHFLMDVDYNVRAASYHALLNYLEEKDDTVDPKDFTDEQLLEIMPAVNEIAVLSEDDRLLAYEALATDNGIWVHNGELFFTGNIDDMDDAYKALAEFIKERSYILSSSSVEEVVSSAVANQAPRHTGGVDLKEMNVTSSSAGAPIKFNITTAPSDVFKYGVSFKISSLEKIDRETLLASLG